MASRTDSNTAKQKVPCKCLKDCTATIYNYIKPISPTSRSASQMRLFQQACSVVEFFSQEEHSILLRAPRVTRLGTGPPIPSVKILQDFEMMRNSFINGTPSPEPVPQGQRKPLPLGETQNPTSAFKVSAISHQLQIPPTEISPVPLGNDGTPTADGHRLPLAEPSDIPPTETPLVSSGNDGTPIAYGH